MNDKVCPGPINGNAGIKEAVIIHAKKVFDSCKDKDCLEDLRVFLTKEGQCLVDRAVNVKPRCAEIIWVYVDVDDVPFNDGFFTVDVKYFYRVTFDVFCGVNRPVEIEGLCTFDKRVILFGSEGKARVFNSNMKPCDDDTSITPCTTLPTGIVEVVDPIVLGCKVVEKCNCGCNGDSGTLDIPPCVCGCFQGELEHSQEGKQLLVTLGQFSIIKLERDTQLLIPSYEYCLPEKECSHNAAEPCDMFRKIHFPAEEFCPPSARVCNDERRDCKDNCGCKR